MIFRQAYTSMSVKELVVHPYSRPCMALRLGPWLAFHDSLLAKLDPVLDMYDSGQR